MDYSVFLKISNAQGKIISEGCSTYDNHENEIRVSEISFLRPCDNTYIIKFKKNDDRSSPILIESLYNGDELDFTIIHCNNNIAIHELTYHKKTIENIHFQNSTLDEKQNFEEITICIEG